MKTLPIYPYEDAECGCCRETFSRPANEYGRNVVKNCFACRMRCRFVTSCQVITVVERETLADWEGTGLRASS